MTCGMLLSDSTVMLAGRRPAATVAPKPGGMMMAPYTWPRVIIVRASALAGGVS